MSQVKIYGVISTYEDVKRKTQTKFEIGEAEIVTEVAKASIKTASSSSIQEVEGLSKRDISTTFRIMSGQLQKASVGLSFCVDKLTQKDYLFSPAALYDGNRFSAVHQTYPPFLHQEDSIGIHMKTTITDVPRLNPDMTGSIELLSGDMATPCVGIFNREKQQGLLLYFEHNTEFGYVGCRFYSDKNYSMIELSAPGVREKAYTMMNSGGECDDQPYTFEAGTDIKLRCVVYQFNCSTMNDFYRVFFETRDVLENKSEFINQLSFSSAFNLLQDKTRLNMWDEENKYLRITPNGEGIYGDWQAGWVGGGINAFALSVDGKSDLAQKADQTFLSIFTKFQNKNGFIYPIMSDGQFYGDDFCHHHKKEVLLLRKNADVLNVTAKYILHLRKRHREPPFAVLQGFLKLADCFVNLFEKYGQIGQFVDIDKATILIGKTASASIAVGGLALAYQISNNHTYLATAMKLGELYICDNLSEGLLNGGPGEIAQCPDSESAFALLEGLVTLYEVTNEKKWLDSAVDCAYQASSWCMAYDFDFPSDSEFYRLNMKTTGSVFANVQNKHSAPGICTLSPVSLFKLYRSTKNIAFLRLCKEIAFHNMQYFSRNDRAIRAWDGQVLPSGWMCERVNTSDWEGKKNIGGVFKGSCWCEISAMLTFVEIPSLYITKDGYYVLDHLIVNQIDNQKFELINDTNFDSEYKIFVDQSKDTRKPLGQCYLENCLTIKLKARERVIWQAH